MAYLKPGFLVSKVMNPVTRIAATSLKVRKRKSGALQVVPVNVLHHDGARYLVAPRGETEWVRNLRAADGQAELSRLGKRERIHATEIPRGERTPLVEAYVKKWGFAVGSQFKQIPDPEDHPAFRIDRGLTMAVHEVAQRGFGTEAGAYERSRPSYPPDAVTWLATGLALGPGVRVVDLAAGTGKFTRLLTPTGAAVVAVEPVAGMWQQLRETSPGVPIVAGTAERLPIRDASLDAVTVAQAFHWFDARAAFAELAHAVRPGGRVGIVWNARDRSVAWVDQVWGIMDRVEKEAPWRDHEAWRDSALGERPGFGELHTATFQHEQRLTPELVVERFRGVSHVAALPDADKERILDEVRQVLATHPDTVGKPELAVPYLVDAMWCERL